ncbi:MAG TPA: peptidylprolyl isomerase [Holophagaceae bacterium]|nr:peptidylprolyl isomerase [Holophagaceae bacterium]
MRPLLRLSLTLLLAALPALAGPKPKVLFKTSAGSFTVELEPDAAPKTVENFLGYVNKGFYKGTIFHRVMKDFMVQGGGYTADMQEKQAGASVVNEAKQALAKGLKNTRGTLAMARTWIPDSAKGQFFINVVNNSAKLDPPAPDGYGYCVFGRVIAGMDVVDKIRNGKTTIRDGMRDVPVKPVVILDATEVKAKAAPRKK